MIAITVEKGMDWKQAVVPTSTKPAASATSSPAQPTAPADAKPPSSGQYVLFLKIIYIINNYIISFIHYFQI